MKHDKPHQIVQNAKKVVRKFMVRATSFCNRSSAASSPDDESDNNARDVLLRNGSIDANE